MRFSIAHDFDVDLDALEGALRSPELPSRLLGLLRPRIEAIETIEFEASEATFRRVLRYQAAAPLAGLEAIVGRNLVTREMLEWSEVFVYTLIDHAAAWQIGPREAYAHTFSASGVYRLEALRDGHTRRVVEGDLNVRVRLVGGLVERIALAEVKKTYDAEAAALRGLAKP